VCSYLVAIFAFIELGVQQLQGTLQVTLRNSPSGQPIDDNEVRRKFQQFGDVKSVQPVGDRIELSISQILVKVMCIDLFQVLDTSNSMIQESV
jgi:transcription initiation factor TFIID subunit 15